MKEKRTISLLVALICIVAAVSTLMAIFADQGRVPIPYESVRGKVVNLYGTGLYRHMSADVAIQGIAQDYVTLFLGIPLLVISLFSALRGSLRGRFVLAGTLNYFLVTYLFYLAMGMYNALFLCYVILLSASFFAFLIVLLSFQTEELPGAFNSSTPRKSVGGFLIFNACAIALLWLKIVVPPLADGSVFPAELEHYTTLIVQGFDLALCLPVCFVSGLLLIRQKPIGYLAATVTVIFLPLLMTALTAKVIAMAHAGVNVIPVAFIIPSFLLLSLTGAVWMLKSILPVKAE